MVSNGIDRAFSSMAPKCPNWPKSTAAPTPRSFLSAEARSSSTPLFAHPASTPQTRARYRIAFARSRQKRGPPVILL